LLALYRAADIALITPLKDGMNLVAKEYCAAHVENSGILVLSEFAGAAPELRTGAILVNPYDELGVAAALRQAMAMPEAERRRRMLRLRRQVRQADLLHWRDRFFAGLECAGVPVWRGSGQTGKIKSSQQTAGSSKKSRSRVP
jgi:trehalose 6-phosphate synthase